jgi:hypothetical protein
MKFNYELFFERTKDKSGYPGILLVGCIPFGGETASPS